MAGLTCGSAPASTGSLVAITIWVARHYQRQSMTLGYCSARNVAGKHHQCRTRKQRGSEKGVTRANEEAENSYGAE